MIAYFIGVDTFTISGEKGGGFMGVEISLLFGLLKVKFISAKKQR